MNKDTRETIIGMLFVSALVYGVLKFTGILDNSTNADANA